MVKVCNAIANASFLTMLNNDTLFGSIPDDLIDKIFKYNDIFIEDLDISNLYYELKYVRPILKSIEHSTMTHFKYSGGNYSEDTHLTYHWYDRVYNTGYRWLEPHNQIDYGDGYDTRLCNNKLIIQRYRDTKKSKKLFRRWMGSITRNRIIKKFNIDYHNYIYKDEKDYPKKDRHHIPRLYIETDYWIKQNIKDINLMKPENPMNVVRHDIQKRDKYICNSARIKSCRRLGDEYKCEVDDARVNQFIRYKDLIIQSDDRYEKLWYLMKMGMLCYKDSEPTRLNQSKEYHYLGTKRSHSKMFYDISWEMGVVNHYDLRQHIYIICNHHEILSEYDIYDYMDNHYFNQLITTNVELPKINHIRQHYKKNVMKELITSFTTPYSDFIALYPRCLINDIFTLYPDITCFD